MQTQNVNVNIRMDKHLKSQMDELCKNLGLNFSTAVNIFANAMVRQQRIPFSVSMEVPNKDTLEALNESRDILAHPQNYKSYDDVHQMIQEITSDV